MEGLTSGCARTYPLTTRCPRCTSSTGRRRTCTGLAEMDRVRAAGGAANCGVAEAKHSPPQTTTVRVDRMLNRLLCVLRVSSESPLESHTVGEARWQVEARGGQENCNKFFRRSYAGSLSDGESPVSGASIAGRRADGPIRWSSSSSSSSADAMRRWWWYRVVVHRVQPATGAGSSGSVAAAG